jgi:hypothetical protein
MISIVFSSLDQVIHVLLKLPFNAAAVCLKNNFLSGSAFFRLPGGTV